MSGYLNGITFVIVTASGQEKEQAKQIFTSSAASGILTNDLVEIMEREQVSLKYIGYIMTHTWFPRSALGP